ncbi:MAG: cysteine synthase A [Phycisphaeraceae bacterium]|nr:cysteine synthase A [Phycisphaeraceae bacterium]
MTAGRGHTYSSIIQTTYDTPLVKLNRVVPDGGANVYVKVEYFNPMSSVKDRIGRAMIEDAEKLGIIKANTHIIEPTSGNTGIALAFVCAAKGYKLTLTMPESMSIERRALLRGLGADLVLTPAAGGMKAAIEQAAEMVAAEDNAWMPQQFENPANPAIHEATTGPEIYTDLAGEVDFFVSGVGTGGTISGVARYIKAHRPGFKAIAVEPEDSPVITQTRAGQEIKPGPHKIQGIGAGFVPKNCDLTIVDDVMTVTNDQAFEMARRLAKEEGLFGGISTGANVTAAIELALQPENAGKNIVTVACSCGERYLSTPMFQEYMS